MFPILNYFKKMFVKVKKYNVNGDERPGGHFYKQVLIAILAGTTFLNFGLQNGWISPMKKVLQSEDSPAGEPLSDTEMSWLASIMAVSAPFGVFLYTYIADTYGRRVSVIAMVVLQAFCWIIKLISTHIAALVMARIIAGVPAGACFNVIPMYVKEISQDNIRGGLVALSMSFQYIGYLTIYAIGSYLNYFTVLWIVVGIPIVASLLLIIIAPESPGFLVKKGKIEDARRTLANLRGLEIDDKIVLRELETIKYEEENFKAKGNISFSSIFRNKATLRGFLLCMAILTISDMNGTFTIITFAWTVMTQSGITVNPELQTLSIPAIMIFGSLVAVLCVEKFGRKPILVGAFSLSTASLACLGTTLLLQQHFDVTFPNWVPVIAIIVSVWSYSAGVLPMTYVIISELFEFNVRAKLIGCIVTHGWLVSFVQLFVYQLITDAFGMEVTYYFFACFNLVGAVLTLVFVPETMGKSVDEIEKILLRK